MNRTNLLPWSSIVALVFLNMGAHATEENPTCPPKLEPLSCISHVREDLLLDARVMRCPNGIKVFAGLVLQRGSRIEGGDIDVVDSGYISARGTEDCPIYLTSASENPAPGDWQFHVHPGEDVETSLTWTVIEYAGEPNREAIETTASDGSIALDHVTIRKALGRTALDLRDGRVTKFSNVAFYEIEGSAIEISPDESGIVEPNLYIDTETVDGPWVHVRGNRLDQNVVWEDIGVPYLIEDFSIRGTLSVDAGTEVLFGRKADLRVAEGGRLVVSGTATNPVKFASVSENPKPGDWNRVVIASTEDNRISHVFVQHGGGNNRQGAITITKSGAVSIDDVTFKNNLTCDIKNNGALQAHLLDFIACP